MRTLARSTFTIALCLYTSSVSAQASDARLEKTVLSEYPKALAKMEAYYSSVRADGTEHQEFYKDDAQFKQNTKFENHFHFECDGLNQLSRRVTEGGEAGYKEFIDGSNPDYRFSLRKLGKDARFVIVDYTPTRADPTPPSEDYPATPRADLRYASGYPAAAYSAFNGAMSRIISSPGFKLKGASRVKEGAEDLIKIEFEFKMTQDDFTHRAWVMVDPDRGWATRKYEGGFGAKGNVLRSGTVEYGDSVNGIPIPKRVERRHPTYHHVFDFTPIEAIEPGSIPPSHFRLSGYGLPEVGVEPAISSGFRGDILLIVLGLVFGIAAIWFTRRARLASAAKPTRLTR